jgi:hypothetical protein
MHEITPADAVFTRAQDNTWHASELARGPWDARAQHGGAPCGLLAHLAESAVDGEGWQLARLTVELVRPVPLGVLDSSVTAETGRATSRVEIVLQSQGKVVAKAHALLIRAQPLVLPDELVPPRVASMPPPSDCTSALRIPGLPDVRSFYYTAMEGRVAAGTPGAPGPGAPGPGAAWLRLKVPLIGGQPNSPAMRAVAAADFGNGISWVLPPDRFNFANADVSLNMARLPVGEWIGLDSSTTICANGRGCTITQMHDEAGPFGIATQTLLVLAR